MPPPSRWNSWTFWCSFLHSQEDSGTEVKSCLILTSVWQPGWSPNVHTEARGRTPRPPRPKGEEGCVGSFSLGLGEECASAVGAGRRRRYQAMKVEGDFWTSPCCLLDWQGAHSKVAHLVAVGRAPFRRARPYCLLDWQGAQAPLGGLVIFSSYLMQLRVDEK
jgi:hypothetical protein